ncbi:MAG: hypothetical protein FWH28_09165 [Clostridiales bacterium]|nr:hypothetical protein [Clostridiales bacterium]
MDSPNTNNITQRIERELGLPSLAEKLSEEVSASDFTSLLTGVFAARAERIAPSEMLRLYAQNPYAKPASCSASQYRWLEADMLCEAEDYGIPGVLLSPAALFGCCSAFGAVSQNKILSANRNLEILSDATNMLALHIAAGLKDGALSHAGSPIHLCTTHRHIRYQAAFDSWMLPHFGIFTIVSAGKSRSSYGFEIDALLFHLRFYCGYWLRKHGSALSLTLNRRSGYKDGDGFFHRAAEALRENLHDIEIVIDEREDHTTYYKGLQATMHAQINGRSFEIGDVGFTDWTQKLLNNPRERLLTSAITLDRQML